MGWFVYGAGSTYVPQTKMQVVKCYPNPATSIINFDFAKNIDKTYTLQVYSFLGKVMSETPVSSSKVSITLNDFYRGIYVYQLKDKAGRIIESGKFQVIK
jgi:hypothetical protein